MEDTAVNAVESAGKYSLWWGFDSIQRVSRSLLSRQMHAVQEDHHKNQRSSRQGGLDFIVQLMLSEL